LEVWLGGEAFMDERNYELIDRDKNGKIIGKFTVSRKTLDSHAKLFWEGAWNVGDYDKAKELLLKWGKYEICNVDDT
jgi:hypothetical protein